MRGFAFLDVVTVPLGNLDGVGTGLFNDGLAAEAAVELDIGGSLHAVELEVFGLGDAPCTLFDVDVAGGAGADATAGVVEEDAVVFGDIKEAHGRAVALVGEGVESELDRLTLGLEGDADHSFGGGYGEVIHGKRRGGVIGHCFLILPGAGPVYADTVASQHVRDAVSRLLCGSEEEVTTRSMTSAGYKVTVT